MLEEVYRKCGINGTLSEKGRRATKPFPPQSAS